MFSFTDIKDRSRTFATINEKSTGDVLEVVYFTENIRDDKFDQEQVDQFTKQLERYKNQSTENSLGHIELDSKYKFEILPHSEVQKTFEKEGVYITGKAGSGKSYQIALYIEKYHMLFPDNQIYYISANNLSNDKSLSKVLNLKRILKDGTTESVVKEINLLTITSVIDFKNYNNVLFVFDDIIDGDVTIDLMEIVGQLNEEERENFMKGAKIKELDFLEKYVMKRMVQTMYYIKKSVSNLLTRGRKNCISCLIVDHKLNSGELAIKIMSQATSVWMFPYDNDSKEVFARFLVEKLGFEKVDAKYVNSLEKYKFEFLYINCGKKFIMTPNLIKLF